MKQKIREADLDWEVDSAGTGHWHAGQLPDRRSIIKAGQYGIDITDQRARQFQVVDFERFDKIFVMDAQNLRDVLRLAKNDEHRAKVEMIMDQIYPGQAHPVPDPYHDDDGFDEVFKMLDRACGVYVSKVK